MPSFKPAYLIHGDDHGRIAERRARLRALAEDESGSVGVEVLEGDASSPQAAAVALSAMTLGLERRFVIVDGAERFKEGDLDALEAALSDLSPDTTVAFFAREDSRNTVPERLRSAVARAGGDVKAEETVKPWKLPEWVAERARELGAELDPGAAKALVARVGERQQRLSRELEKLVLALGPGAQVGADELDELAASSAERKVFSLADALVARNGALAARLYLELSEQGERIEGLLFRLVDRVRMAHDAVTRLDSGESAGQVKRSLRMPPKAADRLLADAQSADRDALRFMLEELADLELQSRGGGTAAPKDTAALRTLLRVSAG